MTARAREAGRDRVATVTHLNARGGTPDDALAHAACPDSTESPGVAPNCQEEPPPRFRHVPSQRTGDSSWPTPPTPTAAVAIRTIARR